MAEETVPRLEFLPDQPLISAAPRGAEAAPRLEFEPETGAPVQMTPEQRQEEALKRAKGVGEVMGAEAMRSIPGVVVGGPGSLETFEIGRAHV